MRVEPGPRARGRERLGARPRRTRAIVGARRRRRLVYGDTQAAAEVDLLDRLAGDVARSRPRGRPRPPPPARTDRAARICEPMWQCSPASCIASLFATRTAASSAAPLATVNPNFESSAPVAMYSCVCASTPGVTRTSTARRAHALAPRALRCGRARRRSRPTIRPMPIVERHAQLGFGLVVAVEHHPRRREPGPVREERFAAGGDVEVEPLLGDEPGHRPAQERLARRTRPRRAPNASRTRGNGRAARLRRTHREVCRTPRRAARGRCPPITRWPRSSMPADRGQQRRGRSAPTRSFVVLRAGFTVVVCRRRAVHLVGRVHAQDREHARPARGGTLRRATGEPG